MTLSDLPNKFPHLKFESNHLLAPHTTVKIGGPAELYVETPNTKDFVELITLARKNQIPVTLLGWGANTLIADEGIKGLVVKNTSNQIDIVNENVTAPIETVTTIPRWQSDDSNSNKKYEFEDLDYNENDSPRIRVEISSGVGLPVVINTLLQQGITGLQWFSRIPGSIGGAIYNNIHGGTHFISEVIEFITVIDKDGELQKIATKDAEFGYDFSRFHHSEEVIVSATFLLFKGDVEKAKQVVVEWAKRKSIQPQNSLGCVFQNLTADQQKQLNLPTPSIGYLIEHVLNKKGFKIGGAMVSEKHCAFIENVGNATAKEYKAVIDTLVNETKEKTGIELKSEIFYLGFDNGK